VLCVCVLCVQLIFASPHSIIHNCVKYVASKASQVPSAHPYEDSTSIPTRLVDILILKYSPYMLESITNTAAKPQFPLEHSIYQL
jgi:hypothetical protein